MALVGVAASVSTSGMLAAKYEPNNRAVRQQLEVCRVAAAAERANEKSLYAAMMRTDES